MPNGIARDHGVVRFHSRLPWYYGHIESLDVPLLVKSNIDSQSDTQRQRSWTVRSTTSSFQRKYRLNEFGLTMLGHSRY